MTTPSGNLYKFMSILGLLSFFSCVLLPAIFLELNIRETNQVRRNLVQMGQERESLINRIKIYEEELAANDSMAATPEFMEMRKELERCRAEIDLRTKQLNLEKDLYDEQQLRERSIQPVMLGALIISALLLVAGMLGWYFRVQRPLNRLIRRELRRENPSGT
ncbi:MAG: hypothetical protein AB7U05_06320 [Mangrovibacterium sp.]